MSSKLLSFGPILTLVIACGAAAPVFAQDEPLKVSGSVRLRYENINGQPRVGFNAADDLLNLRTRIMLDYVKGPLRFGVELYDSRVWLDEPGTPITTGEVNAAEFVQLNAGAKFEGDVPVSVQAGRFTLNLGSRRLVAADDYRNTTNGYAGLRLDLGDSRRANATFIYVSPQVRLPDDAQSLRDADIVRDRESGDLALHGALGALPAGLGVLQPSYFHLDENDRPDLATRDRHLDTVGLRFFREPQSGAWDFDVEAFVQTGEVSASTAPAAATLDVDATFIHAELGYRWESGWKPRLAIEYDRASGDGPGSDYERFDTLFGMRRAELAPAGLYNAVGRSNTATPGVRLELEPSPRLDGFIAWRALYLASDTDSFSTSGVRDPSGASGDFAGHQIDARVRYWLAPQRWRLETNFVYLAKGRFLETAPNAPASGDTTYVALDLTWLF